MLPSQIQKLKNKKEINSAERDYIQKWENAVTITKSFWETTSDKLVQLLHNLQEYMKCIICVLMAPFIIFILYVTKDIHITDFKVTDSYHPDVSSHPDDSPKLCLYDTNKYMDLVNDPKIGYHGNWTNLNDTNCRNENNVYCTGDLGTMYDFNIDRYSIFQYNDDCIYHIYKPLDEDLLQCLNNKPILFLGDSTMHYMVYYSLFELLLNVSLFPGEMMWRIDREIELNSHIQQYNISINYRFTSAWPKVANYQGTTAFDGPKLWNYLDRRFFSIDCDFGNITHVVFHSLFHDICHQHRNKKTQEEGLQGYKERLVKIYIGLLNRIEATAKRNESRSDDDYMLYIWPSTHVGNSGNLTKMFFLDGTGFDEQFNGGYDYYLRAMLEAIVQVIEMETRYKEHIVFIDTSSMSEGHRNGDYGDGLHYGSGEDKDGMKRSPIVRNMMIQAVLNEICLRP